MNNFLQRLFTALIGAALVVFAILYSEWSFLLLLLLMVILGLREFYSLVRSEGIQPQAGFGIVLGILPFLSPLMNSAFMIQLNFLPLLLVSLLYFYSRAFHKSRKPFTNIAYTYCIFYIVAPVFMFYLISSGDTTRKFITEQISSDFFSYCGLMIPVHTLQEDGSDEQNYLNEFLQRKPGKVLVVESFLPLLLPLSFRSIIRIWILRIGSSLQE
ncbi:MAG: phosphatidate cytidylyltransferase [Bacteroidetes bacterium]|nr:phosphatidate cytidylyltransferase [Bacteroidota bacterium]